ncbi:phosphopantetheine-binding protein [Chitinibacter sp. SCUT-21]|uniref:phosphopantetheine-binding protein n=1 Tax=Chitinibacter sp. SCUT-21 TaxID=2970891 RepID=UPI0035A6ED76
MGLDTVELVMAIEKEFAVTIADEDAAQIFTVGQLCHYVQLRLVAEHGLVVTSQDAILRKIAQILSREFGITSDQIHPNARFIDDLGLD